MDPSSHLLIPLLLLAPILFFLYKFLHTQNPNSQKTLPPSPPRLPLIGNLHQLGSFPHRSLQSLSKRYGPLMLLHFGRVPVIVVSSADGAREIMKNQDSIFANRPKLSIPDRLTFGSRDIAFAPYGEYWRQVRSICVVQLLSQTRVQSFRRIREEETSLMVEKIRQLGSASSAVNMSDVLVSTTNDVICRVALGRKYGGDREGKKFKKFVREYEALLGASPVGEYVPLLAWTSWLGGWNGRVRRVAQYFDEFFGIVLEEHRERRKREKDGGGDEIGLDFVDILLDFQRESKGSNPFDDETVKAIILDMFAAGTDTTVSALEWTMAELVRNPRAMRTLQKEVRQVAGEKSEINEDDLEKMPYLKTVIKESLRLHTPAPLLVPRESTQDTEVLGYSIASNTRLMINAWAIARDPSLWENPEEFYPERFLGSSVDFRGLHFELIPFGAGRRGCPGIAFAMAVDQLALAKLVHRFDFALPEGEREEDMDMSEIYGIAVYKKVPLLVVATPHAC